MAQASPLIQEGILTSLRDGSAVQIVVDSLRFPHFGGMVKA